MPAERSNFCRILGLNPYREDEYALSEIETRLEAKKEEWERTLQNRLSYRISFENTKNIQAIPEIRSVMRNDVLRHAEFEGARRIVAAKASHLRRCTVTSRTGQCAVIPSLVTKLLKNLGWDDLTNADLIKASGIYNSSLPPAAPSNIEKTFENLRDLGFYTPVEFINSLLSLPGMNFGFTPMGEDADPNTYFGCIDSIFDKRERLSRREIPGWETYNAAIVKLHNIRTSKEVENIRIYGQTYHALEPAMALLDQDSGVGFTAAYTGDLIANLVPKDVADADLAVRILENYCFSHSYPANFTFEDANLSICPACHALTAVTGGACACGYCGAPVRVMCPVCGEVQGAAGSICTNCKTPFDDSGKAVEALETSVREALDSGAIHDAEQSLTALLAQYPYHDSGALDAEVKRTAVDVSDLREETAAMFRSRRYHSLKVLVDGFAPTYPFLTKDEEIGPRYSKSAEAVEKADALVLGASSDEDYISAAEACPDHPDALAVLRTRPPEGPSDGIVEPHADGIVVRYSVPYDRRGMTFCIYRGTGGFPEVNSDTVPTAETDKGVWLDTGAEPGAPCYYRILARRWGVLSEEYAEAGPGVIAREITNVTLTQLEDGIHAEYTRPAGCTRVLVWRKRAGFAAGTGDEVPIPAGDSSFDDRGLRGSEMYVYLFVAEYNGSFRSSGTVYRAETLPYPEPVTDLKVEWNRRDGTYTAGWTSEAPVKLFCGPSRPEFPARIVPLADIRAFMTEIETVPGEEGEVSFRLPPGAASFITPVIEAGTTGIVGDTVLVANLRPITGITRRTEPGAAVITFPWPPGSIGAVTDYDGHRTIIDRNPGEQEKSLRFNLGDASSRTVSLFAVYDIDGRQMPSVAVSASIWSDGFHMINYDISYSASRADRTKNEVRVTINCPDRGSLPCCVVVMADEGIPLKASDGRVIWMSDDPILLANGTAVGAFFLPKEETDVSRMRLFLKDRGEYSRFRINHPLYRRH